MLLAFNLALILNSGPSSHLAVHPKPHLPLPLLRYTCPVLTRPVKATSNLQGTISIQYWWDHIQIKNRKRKLVKYENEMRSGQASHTSFCRDAYENINE
jgi:hypothetical protein